MDDDILKQLELPPKMKEHLDLMKQVMDSDPYKTAFDMVDKYGSLKTAIDYVEEMRPSLALVKGIPDEYFKLNEITQKLFNQIPTSTNNETDSLADNDIPTTHDVDEFFETVEKIVPQIDDEECRNEVQQLVADAMVAYEFWDFKQITFSKLLPLIYTIFGTILSYVLTHYL